MPRRVRERMPDDMKPGRNEPCPCGSGKKFKKCHQDAYEGGLFVPAGTPDDFDDETGIGASDDPRTCSRCHSLRSVERIIPSAEVKEIMAEKLADLAEMFDGGAFEAYCPACRRREVTFVEDRGMAFLRKHVPDAPGWDRYYAPN